MANHTTPRERPEPELTLAELRGHCARMAPHWPAPAAAPAAVPPSRIHGVVVEPASVRLIAAAAEYGA
ncbi:MULTISPECIES: hypothetical protein [Streptomyces]|uniref:Uncharacterized protein n=1 Tax=Streptomyces sudanensis TaxID=436397 RepID=A0ABY4TE89_9ACTN|nr:MULTISPECIES: hypothetical protein [Streptomyces]MCP9959264.1 hypothetical protein [Streptomyces sudanensis]MCP9988339.1 hypothetical protein [Streptomyces sudanensis]MCQ0000276.1 hypothetical protein [Streptomyces sudanensis]URN15841.1 hypothetical protein MW084_07590 [Streptomyces sudanensis]